MVAEFLFWTGFVAFARKIGAMYYARRTLRFLRHALIVVGDHNPTRRSLTNQS
jgi:hypothetical protein